MAVRRVIQMGHPLLREVSEPVAAEEFETEAFQRLCDDLLETMLDYDGVGLAAPQIGVRKRVVVLELDDEEGPEFLVNPVIEVIADSSRFTWEGCLSVEGLRGRVERPDQVRVRAFDRDGSRKGYELHGYPAVVVQHECDHLDGVLYVDKVDPKTLAFMREYRRYGPLDEDGDDLDDEDLEGVDEDLLDYADPDEEDM
ncbi:MAG: peptide deformylase [Myxococcota bacterium]